MSRPGHDIRRLGAVLRAAVEACGQRPKPRAVHRLRTTCRRLQAQLTLLLLNPDMEGGGAIRKGAKRFWKAADPVRKAAGRVRDLDVHIENLARFTGSAQLRLDRRVLKRALLAKREGRAKKLQKLIERFGEKLVRAVMDLDQALLPARALEVNPDEGSEVAEAWYRRLRAALDPTDFAQLHGIRKAAKLARYMAEESAEGNPRAVKAAERFNRIQEAAGRWHDLFVLAEVAKQQLREGSPLVAAVEEQRDRAHRSAVRLASIKV